MGKKFAVILTESNDTQKQALASQLPKRASWWHYSPDVWLLKFRGDVSATSLRDEIKQVIPGALFLVMQIDSDFWAGFGPKEWQNWFNTVWDKTD
jgi:hypothetical protein